MPRICLHPSGQVASVSCSRAEVSSWHSGYGFNSSGKWPCGTLSSSFRAEYSESGDLIDLCGPGGRSIDPDADELNAMVADACAFRGHPVPASCAHLDHRAR